MVEISTDPRRLDVDFIHSFLTSSSYWARGRSREEVELTIRKSLCFGAYADGRQVGFARVITDEVAFGYLADVFSAPDRRGEGIGKALMQAIVDHPTIARLPVFLLRTKDAHSLYAKFGFSPLPKVEEMMGRYRP